MKLRLRIAIITLAVLSVPFVSAQSAVLLVTRFNIPVGGATTIMADDPGC